MSTQSAHSVSSDSLYVKTSNRSVGKDPVEPVKVAVVQAEPSWFDVEAAVKHTCELIAEAGASGAKLIAFPELWIPGYPTYIFAHDKKAASRYTLQYYRNSVEVDSNHMFQIRTAARAAKIMVVLCYSERDQGSLYMSQTFIDTSGAILLHRRKLKPTGYERTVFGDGSGDCSRNVVQTTFGRIGALQCFEHLQPLLKYNTFFQGEQIHVASWPCLFPVIGDMPFFDSVESCRMASHVYAVEGGTFVLLPSQVQTEKGLKANGLGSEAAPEDVDAPHTAVIGGGFSVVIGPDGRGLTKPMDPKWQGLLYHELDFNDIYVAKQTVDCVGHYSRPDIFSLQVNSKVNRTVVGTRSEAPFQHETRFPALDEEP